MVSLHDAVAQPGDAEQAWADVATIDGIIKAYYEVVSGPAGEPPDQARDEWLHHPNALVGLPSSDSMGVAGITTTDLDGYYVRFGGVRTQPFYEWEIHRETQRFGNLAHVWSTYATAQSPDGEPIRRGINSIQLHFDGSRWWILSWAFDNERPGNSLPAEYEGGDNK